VFEPLKDCDDFWKFFLDGVTIALGHHLSACASEPRRWKSSKVSGIRQRIAGAAPAAGVLDEALAEKLTGP
jgi:hypothetical protein